MTEASDETKAAPDRRRFMTWLSTLLMGGGLVAAYGSLGAFFGRFLYPARPAQRGWMFVHDVASVRVGNSIPYELPDGAPVNIARRADTGGADDFIALSSTCPHLGCRVHWEAQNNRFFCPCHNGVFTPEGKAVEGPPADAGQSLPQYPLDVRAGLLYIQVPLDQLAETKTKPRAWRRPRPPQRA